MGVAPLMLAALTQNEGPPAGRGVRGATQGEE